MCWVLSCKPCSVWTSIVMLQYYTGTVTANEKELHEELASTAMLPPAQSYGSQWIHPLLRTSFSKKHNRRISRLYVCTRVPYRLHNWLESRIVRKQNSVPFSPPSKIKWCRDHYDLVSRWWRLVDRYTGVGFRLAKRYHMKDYRLSTLTRRLV